MRGTGVGFHKPGRGDSIPLTVCDECEAETFFPMLGMSIQVLSPGDPNTTYHWETKQEDFLVLLGELSGCAQHARVKVVGIPDC